jgi:hypothetical protein
VLDARQDALRLILECHDYRVLRVFRYDVIDVNVVVVSVVYAKRTAGPDADNPTAVR